MTESTVEAADLSVRLGGYPVFSGVNLTVDHGEVLAVLGDIGAGKSTLLRVLGGQVTPSGGAPETLSQGLRRRLALAEAFCRPSRLLLADDPEFGLDTTFRPVPAEILAGYVERGGTVLLATHDLDLALAANARTFALG